MQLTSEDIQRYARIALQWGAGFLVSHGMLTQGASWIEPAIGFGVTIATFLWTLYGTRVQAKINEVAKLETTLVNGQTVKLVENMKIHDVEVANAAPANVVPVPPASVT